MLLSGYPAFLLKKNPEYRMQNKRKEISSFDELLDAECCILLFILLFLPDIPVDLYSAHENNDKGGQAGQTPNKTDTFFYYYQHHNSH
jgi:hypothetical protein